MLCRFERTRVVATGVAVVGMLLAATGAWAEQRNMAGYVGLGAGVAVDVSDDVPDMPIGPTIDLRAGLIVQPFGLELQTQYGWQEIESDSIHTLFSSVNMMYTPFYHFEFDDDSLVGRFEPYVLAGAGIGWGRGEGGAFDIDGKGVGRFWRFGGGSAFRFSDLFDLDCRVEYVLSPRGSIDGLDRLQATVGFRYILGGGDD